MLRELRVKNFAIVEDGRLQIGPNMSAFTGETGAGKSLLFDAVTLLLGGKAHSHLVRTGASSAEVEGVFDLSKDALKRKLAGEMGFEVEADDGHLLFIRREITGGDAVRNRIWIQGKSATRTQLHSLLGDWVEISGQHEFLRLGNEDYILTLVDQFGGLREEVRDFYRRHESYDALVGELTSARAARENRAARIDYLNFQIEEFEKAGVAPEAAQEEEKLIALRSRLGNLDRIGRSLEKARVNLEGDDAEARGALLGVQSAARELRGLQDYGDEFKDLIAGIDQAEVSLRDLAAQLGQLAGRLEADPESLEQAESRLSQMTRIKRKYAKELSELVEVLAGAKTELAMLENSEELVSDLETRVAQAETALRASGERLHERRVNAAQVLSKAWEKDIRQLGMKQAKLHLQAHSLDAFRTNGMTRVEALFSANAGEAPRPIGKVASGGELSRILLALKHIVAGRSEIGIYLFDEVDSGIGGETAHAVAARLRGIAKDNQVIVVTHLAQIAAVSHDQFRIRKTTEKGKTRTLVEKMSHADRTEEIARMLGDTGSKAAQKLAKELLQRGAEA